MPGIDGIMNEIWKYGYGGVKDWIWSFCNWAWKGEEWPEGWREVVIVPILKKRKEERIKDYRRVTLFCIKYT